MGPHHSRLFASSCVCTCLIALNSLMRREWGRIGGECVMGRWTLDDIPWDRLDRNKIDPEIVRLVKAASLVEYNGGAYAHHLCRIFDDDPDFQRAARRWGDEEIRDGRGVARWAALADPSYDF